MSVSSITVESVEAAMSEANATGRGAFLKKYGFGFANTYLCRHGGKFFDPKAVLGAAHGFLDGEEPLTPTDFDATTAITKLRALGFQVVDFSVLWWVNQGSTYAAERKGGYVWAPKLTKSGRPVGHHVAVSELRAGHIVVHYKDGAIRAIGYVSQAPQSVRKPAELDTDAWGTDGYGCAVTYRDLVSPIPREQVPNRADDVGPFDVNGGVKQGYLFRIASHQLFPLLEFLNERVPDLFERPQVTSTSPFVQESAVAVAKPILELLLAAKNIVLEGVPGTGKSFAIEALAEDWKSRTGRELVTFDGMPYIAVVMHPSSSYEDFVEGLRPKAVGHLPTYFDELPASAAADFKVDDGFFLKVCAEAVRNPAKDLLVLVDELNRCNVASVLGDLLLTIEASRRAKFEGDPAVESTAANWKTKVPVRLPYSGRLFFVPDNVYVVATTNTTDRSVAPLDAAIRRRFAFYRLEPDIDGPRELATTTLGKDSALVTVSADVISNLNESVLATCLGPDAMIGPSYLYGLVSQIKSGGGSEAVARLWRFSLVPQLIDVLRSYGAEALLDRKTRDEWFGEHGSEGVPNADGARQSLEELDAHLGSLGMRVVVDGTGLSRGARIVDPTTARVDVVAAADVSVEIDNGLDAGISEHDKTGSPEVDSHS